MTTHVIMNVDRPNGSGGIYKAGVEYDLADDLATLWRGMGICRLTTVRSEQTGAVVSATTGNFPDAPAMNKRIPVEAIPSGSGVVIQPIAGLSPVISGVRAQRTGQVASHCQLMTSFFATNKQIMSQVRHFARDSLTEFQLVFPNWYVQTAVAGAEVGTGSDATLTASIEYPTGVFTQITFGGSATGTLKDGLNTITDTIKLAIPRGAQFMVRSFWQSSAGVIYNTKGYSSNGNDRSEAAASGLTDKTMSGTVGSTTAGVYYGPVAIIATTTASSLFLLGDSKVNGFGDTAGVDADVGLFARSVGRDFAYINCGQPTDRAMWFAGKCARRLELAQYCTHVLCNYGRNDIYLGAQTLANMQALVQTVCNLFGGRPVHWATLGPDTTSTDSWATTANQTVKAQESTRVSFNNWLRSGGAAGPAGYVEIADQLETSRDSGIWKAPGYTTDGIHEAAAANAAIRDSGAVKGWLFV